MRGRAVKLDAYIRVSKVGSRSGDSFISPDAQADCIRSWADNNAVRILEWHTDLDQSGAKLTRPEFDRMMRRVTAGETQGVVVAKIDRFARSLVGATEALRRIDAAGAMFFSVQDGADVPTSAGRLHQRMMLSLAEFELDRIRENWNTARERAVGRGVYLGVVPFGYKKSQGAGLIPELTAELVTASFLMRSESRKLADISTFLNGRAKPQRGAQFTPVTVGKMLKNRVYLGELKHGDFFMANAHQPLTDPETFVLAQGQHRATQPAVKHPLVGLLRCAGCRYVLNYRHGKRFRCTQHYASGNCKEPAVVDSTAIEQVVTDAIMRRLPELATEADLLESQAAVDIAEAALVAYRDDLDLQNLLKHSDFVGGLTTRNDALEAARSRYSAALAHRYGIDLATIPDDWDSMDQNAQRTTAHKLIEAVFVRNGDPLEDNIAIVWSGEKVELPSRGARSYELAPFRW